MRNYQQEQDARAAAALANTPVEESARGWRNKELKATDYIVSISDFTPHEDWITYRQDLRDWPSDNSFPENPPIKPNQPTPVGYKNT